jgi:hypothetical protein
MRKPLHNHIDGRHVAGGNVAGLEHVDAAVDA